MVNWLTLTDQRRKEIINNINFRTGLSVAAIEKDWYVTMALYAVFRTPWTDEIVFKGGTSLSKAWQLIQRFSEDVDLSITPQALGLNSNIPTTASQIKKLRNLIGKFMKGEFMPSLTKIVRELGINGTKLSITLRQQKTLDEDPRVIELEFPTLFPAKGKYLKRKVELEIGARSLRDPFESRSIQSIIDENFPEMTTGIPEFSVSTVRPDRTCLEKMFLLHEEFTKPTEKHRYYRMSRHLYDLYYILNSQFGKHALVDQELFRTIRNHRSLFNKQSHVDYNQLKVNNMIIIPPADMMSNWETDYKQMRESMMANNPPEFEEIINQLRKISLPGCPNQII